MRRVILRVENHANTDFPYVKARGPIVATALCVDLEDAVTRARRIQANYVRGEHKVCDIRVYVDAGVPMASYHVSQNGRIWQGPSYANSGIEADIPALALD